MRKLVITIVVLMCSQAFGLSLLGPPKANLDRGQSSVGFGYIYSDMDLETKNVFGQKWTEKVETNSLLGTFGYGIIDNIEVFARLGFTDVKADDFDGDFEFDYGFGTKVTFAENDSLSWGSIFQIHWLEGDDTITGFIPGFGVVTAEQEFEAYEIQIAVGPTYKYDSTSIYGGPFLHFVNGDYDAKIAGVGSASLDIEEESIFGGYIGIATELTENTNIGVEFQFTGDAQAIGVRYVLRF